MSTPRITVLMAVRDGGPFVAQAIESVLAQTWRDFEFLVIDDASSDATPEVCRGFSDPRLRFACNERNLGLTASLNRGLALARGEWIARQDADDLAHPQRLEKQATFLAANPPVAAVGSQCRLIDARGRSLGRKDFPWGHAAIRWAHLWDNALAHSAVMFRKAAVLAAGGYDESFPASQDYELWSRLGERHALTNLPERLQTLRVVASSVTQTHRRPELIRRVQREHWRRLFPGREPTEAELDLIALFRSRVPPERLAEFHALFDELLGLCVARQPWSGDLARTAALQIERVGYNLLPAARGAAWRELIRSVRVFPPRVLAMPWLRIAALTVLGEGARAWRARATGTSDDSI